MEGSYYYRGRKSLPVFYYCISIHNKQFYTRLDLDWYRVWMLLGCFDCTPAYSSTSTVGNFEWLLKAQLHIEWSLPS
jgi:hypothetical protein